VPPEATQQAAAILTRSILKVLVFNKDHRGSRLAGDERVLAAAAEALSCSLLALREKANMQGLLDMGADPRFLPGYVDPSDVAALDALEKLWCVTLHDLAPGRDVASLLRAKQLKAAIVLGEDPLGADGFPEDLREGLLAADFLVVGDVVRTATAQAAHVVLPLSGAPETSGTMTNCERRVQRLRQAVPPAAGRQTIEILSQLAAQMGHRFKMRYASPDEVTAEIRRAIPSYAALDLDDGGAIWDAAAMRLPVPPLAGGLPETPITPAATLFLDRIEARFASWFDPLLERARRQLPMV
jgi:predicted molibdopterin-dependent oxidoreductase YjgC